MYRGLSRRTQPPWGQCAGERTVIALIFLALEPARKAKTGDMLDDWERMLERWVCWHCSAVLLYESGCVWSDNRGLTIAASILAHQCASPWFHREASETPDSFYRCECTPSHAVEWDAKLQLPYQFHPFHHLSSSNATLIVGRMWNVQWPYPYISSP